MIKLVLATSNPNKVKEYNDILLKHDIEVISFKDLNIVLPDVKEDGKTFKDNALIKALHAAKLTSLPVIADDSGLCIKALNDFPGLYSARYAQECGGFRNACSELVNKLNGLEHSASFHCVIALCNWAKEPIVFEATAKGQIVDKYNNETSFGYDPIFKPDEANDTYHNISKEIKDQISHRAKACELLIKYLENSK